ncbi:MAG TPA: hypothetical protein VH370_12795 [Humisphaera sp.]|jgi:hypothetical protein|nr:hypothetical protein [Humisphaera sp.]
MAIAGIVVGIVVGGALELVHPPIANADMTIKLAEIFELRIRFSLESNIACDVPDEARRRGCWDRGRHAH